MCIFLCSEAYPFGPTSIFSKQNSKIDEVVSCLMIVCVSMDYSISSCNFIPMTIVQLVNQMYITWSNLSSWKWSKRQQFEKILMSNILLLISRDSRQLVGQSPELRSCLWSRIWSSWKFKLLSSIMDILWELVALTFLQLYLCLRLSFNDCMDNVSMVFLSSSEPGNYLVSIFSIPNTDAIRVNLPSWKVFGFSCFKCFCRFFYGS